MLEAGGNTLHSPEAHSCQMICNWPYWYTTYAFRGKSIFSLYSLTHTGCSSAYFPGNGNRNIFFRACRVATTVHVLPFCPSSKHLSADRVRHEHRRFYMATSVKLILFILADLKDHMANLSQNKRVFSFNPLCSLKNRLYQTPQPIFACYNLACKPPRNACMCQDTKRYASKPNQDKLNQDKMADRIRAGV